MKRILALSCALLLGGIASANGATFFTDGFDYANGDITAVSSGAWVPHSGTTNPLLITDGVAVVKLTGTQDVNRGTGGPTLAPGSTWYYGLTFSVTDLRPDPGTQAPNPLDTYYLAHFSDTGPANFRGRLYVTADPSDPTKFTLGLASGTTEGVSGGNPVVGGPIELWESPLEFGQTYTTIVSYTATEHDPRANIPEDPFSPFVGGGSNTVPNLNPQPYSGNDGKATLWVNPTTSASTSISAFPDGDDIQLHTNGNDLQEAARMRALALRQGSTFGQNGFNVNTLIDIVSIGDSFDDVLAAVSPEEPGLPGDFNLDGFVDGRDFLLWQRGGSIPEGNLSANDLLAWQTAYGSAPPLAAVSVPEPGCLALVALGCALVALRKRN